ncbi:MAG: hypothetical protein KDA57_14585 [Planctomycetales bacterium]|nr:hypothetical protein [Planctomycetales bacterium]
MDIKRAGETLSTKQATCRVLALLFISTAQTTALLAQTHTSSPHSSGTLDAAKVALAEAFAGLIKQAIPLEYDKKKNWGTTKNITVGLRNEGLKLYRRKKAVDHGVWKHYQVKLVDPEKNLAVRLENLSAVDGSRIRFTLVIAAKLDTWARAKVYQYGIHLIALELVGDTRIELALDCEVGVRLQTKAGLPGLAIDPKVIDARLALPEFHVRRVSDASGPLVHELSSGVRRLVEHELKGPRLVEKANRSIEKRRDRLELSLGELVDSSWWPLASLPELQQPTTRSR